MCRMTKKHSAVICNMVDLKHQLDILDVLKQIKTSLIVHSKYRLDMVLLLLIECWLHCSKTDKPRSEVNKKDVKHLDQLTNIVHEERAKHIRVENVSDAIEGIIVGDVPEVSYRQSTVFHKNGETSSPGKELDHPLVVDSSSVTTTSSVSKENLHDFTDRTISTFGEQDIRGVSIDLDRNDGVPLQEVKSTNIACEAYDFSTFNTSLDLSDFDEDEFDGIISKDLASIENVNAQEFSDIQLSPGCIQVSEETDDPIMFNIHFDEPRQGWNEQHNFLRELDCHDDYCADECRGETKDDEKISETKLDSGLGDSIKTISVDCSSVSVLPYDKSEGYCASWIILDDASSKGKNENLSNEGTHILSTPEDKILTLFNTPNVSLWSYTNVTFCRNFKKETKWMVFRRRRSNDSFFGYESYHSDEQSINDSSFSPLCKFRLKIRHAGDSDGNTSDCDKCNYGMSSSRVNLFDIPINEESEKSVPVIIFPSLHGSAIRFLCSVEYIVLPVSLKTYFKRVTEGTFTREEMMAYEWIRYASFNSFPRSIDMSTTRLANAGFYSTGQGTQARCFCCKVTHDQWSRGDDPYEVHRRISPNCPFLRGEAHCPQNIPIYQQDEEITSRVNDNSRHPMQAQRTPTTEIINPASAQAISALGTDYDVENGQESLKRTEPSSQSSPGIEQKESSHRNHLTIQQNKDGRQYSDNNQSMQNGTALPVYIDDNRKTQSSRPENQGVPVSARERAPLSIAQQPTDDAYNTDYRNPGNFYLPSRNAKEGNAPDNQSTNRSGGHLTTTEGPKHSNYQMLEERIQSFNGWPVHLDQTPQLMAEAGFFYVGIQDYVRCFQCGGGLKNFERGDNPWVEHTRWYPQCAYVLAKMGQRFVDAVAKKQTELLAAQQSGQNVIDTSPSKSASVNQSDSSGSRAAQDSVNPYIVSPGKQASSNQNTNQIINATKGHSTQSRPVYRNVDARLSGPVSLAYPASGNTHGHSNGKSKEHYSQREALNVPEASSMPPFDPQSLIEEYSRLRNTSRCKVCQQRDAVIAFLPCGHLATCETCAPTQTACCVCQKKILASIKTYK
ncbi:hypothetical protein ACJMK2_005197 [Sinanodonta woodiana]|uniref:Uncharacterized protein n=1 Tax=Sinanodonta woodiana TaxID=1069815 RepID=A0ABD3VQL3_SINWO